MEAKIVVGTKTGKSYNIEAKDELAAVFVGKRIGDVVNVTPLGLKGYEVRITGGSDKQGFPMRKDAHVVGRIKALMSTRTQGYKPDDAGVRVRKTVVGDIINDSVSQVNTVVVKEGKDSIEKLLALDKPAEGEAKEGEAPKEAPKEEAKPPKEEKAESPKKEAPKQPAEKPKEEKLEGEKEEKKEEPPKKEAPEEPKAEPKKKEAPEKPKEKKTKASKEGSKEKK